VFHKSVLNLLAELSSWAYLFYFVTQVPKILPVITTESPPEQSNVQISTQHQVNERQHQFNWERGQVDYLGIDSFENILSKLNNALEEPSSITIPTKTMTLPTGSLKKMRGAKTSPPDQQPAVTGSIPGDRLERIIRTGSRSRAVLTDEGAVFYEPGSNSPPAIAAGDKQLDHVERDMSVEIRKHAIFINSSTGEPEERQKAAEERINSLRAKDSASWSTGEGLPRDTATISDDSRKSKDDTQNKMDVPIEVDQSPEQAADRKIAKDVILGAAADTDTNIIRTSDAKLSTGADVDADQSSVTTSSTRSKATGPEKSRSGSKKKKRKK